MADPQEPSLESLPDQVDELLCAPSEEHRQIFLQSTSLVWIDAGDDAPQVVRRFTPYFAAGELRVSGEDTLVIRFRGRRASVKLWHDASDRHRALVALGRALAPDFEPRVVVDSLSSATLAFAILPRTVWRELVQFHGQAVNERFCSLDDAHDVWEIASGSTMRGAPLIMVRS